MVEGTFSRSVQARDPQLQGFLCSLPELHLKPHPSLEGHCLLVIPGDSLRSWPKPRPGAGSPPRAPTSHGSNLGVSEEQDSGRGGKSPNIRPELEKLEKSPRTADSGRHVLEAAAPSPTLAVL